MTKINHWLMKSEPDAYSWDMLVARARGRGTGCATIAANNMRAHAGGRSGLFLPLEHRGGDRGHGDQPDRLPDPTDETGKWACVKVKPVRKLKRPVTLKQIKADPQLAGMEMIRLSRLSVSAVTQSRNGITFIGPEGLGVNGIFQPPVPPARHGIGLRIACRLVNKFLTSGHETFACSGR
jgi:predicted RNA-binding protein with PUA-like domain